MEFGLPAGAGGAEPGNCSANSAIIKARVFTEVTHSVHYIFLCTDMVTSAVLDIFQ